MTTTLARAELTMLLRNRTAAVTAVVMPLALGALLIVQPPPQSSTGLVATLLLLAVLGLTVLNSATTTLLARRQQHVLQRWRTAPVPASSVLLGTLTPVGALLVTQSAVLFAAAAYATGSVPAQPAVLAVAVALGGAVSCAAAFVTAAFTRTVEAVNITVVPAFAALFAGGMWAASALTGQITWPMRATGGGAVAELVRIGWDGPADGDGRAAALTAAASPALALTLLTGGAVLAAWRWFRWESRA